MVKTVVTRNGLFGATSPVSFPIPTVVALDRRPADILQFAVISGKYGPASERRRPKAREAAGREARPESGSLCALAAEFFDSGGVLLRVGVPQFPLVVHANLQQGKSPRRIPVADQQFAQVPGPLGLS